jgi:hypothetical protein
MAMVGNKLARAGGKEFVDGHALAARKARYLLDVNRHCHWLQQSEKSRDPWGESGRVESMPTNRLA